jgi:hypothetical protein
MSDRYRGIRSALTMAMLTGQPVNVGLNRGGTSVKVEGVIQEVHQRNFRIELESDDAAAQQSVDTIPISEAEYVEYS